MSAADAAAGHERGRWVEIVEADGREPRTSSAASFDAPYLSRALVYHAIASIELGGDRGRELELLRRIADA